MSLIEIRLRRALYVRSQAQREIEAMTGIVMPPLTIPARTTLRIIDFGQIGGKDGAFMLLPDGSKLFVDRLTIRDSAYIPRTRQPPPLR